MTPARLRLLLALVIAGVVFAVLATRARVLAAPAQPLPFSHQVHVEAGAQCLFCHTAALRSDMAGLPSVQKCVGCHTVISTEEEAIQDLAGYWERGEAIPWAPVNRQPEFVFFSHQAHLGAGLNCETCHGDVGRMTVARPVLRMDMGWCLECHLQQPPQEVARLADCLACQHLPPMSGRMRDHRPRRQRPRPEDRGQPSPSPQPGQALRPRPGRPASPLSS